MDIDHIFMVDVSPSGSLDPQYRWGRDVAKKATACRLRGATLPIKNRVLFREFAKTTCFCPRHDGDLVHANHSFFHVGRDCPPCRILGPPRPRRTFSVLGLALELVAALWTAGTMLRIDPATRGHHDPCRGRRLMVLGALDTSGRLAGIAPWYLKRSRPRAGCCVGWAAVKSVPTTPASSACPKTPTA